MPELNDDGDTKLRTFCTYFDSKYLDRGLCLWASLGKFYRRFRLFVCCFDVKAFDTLSTLSLPGVVPVALDDVEASCPGLVAVKPTRSRAEYFFTATPSWIRYVLDMNTNLDQVTYLDSDLLFFSSPEVLFDAMAAKDASVGIIGHRFTPALQHLSVYGTYNVGWVTFRRNGGGMTCLMDWQSRCIEWCFDELDGNRFADQKYLDAWPSTYKDVLVLDHEGANVALWNIEPGSAVKSGQAIEIRGAPLIFYHFHGLSQVSKRVFFTNARLYCLKLDRVVCRHIYGRYMLMLRSAQEILKSADIQPLIRYPHSREDVQAALRSPLSGAFLLSWRTPRRTLGGLRAL